MLIIVWGVFLVSDGIITIGGLIAANILAARVLSLLGTIAQTIFRKDLSFDVKAGECVALLGRVGSGKSTAGKVLAGLIAADSGSILIDGIALGQYDPAELRRGIGYLPQSPELFTGTLRENLTVGNPHASDADIQRALYFAAMDDFLAEVPEGLDLFLGEQGMRLSGGQRQGVALARLLLRHPKMLFLDEPTNAMDQKMQGLIIARLAELHAEGTGMMICTHRQSLAAMAGRLIVMDKGRAVLDGARDDILEKLRAMVPAAGKA